MDDRSGISWTDASWNPIRGCTRVSEGCRHCYAETTAARFSQPGQPYHGLAKVIAPRDLLDRVGGRRDGWTGKVLFIVERLALPLRWRKPRRIFVDSMSDLFHEKISNEQIAAVFGVMAACPQHTFQILTKRARRMREWFEWVEKRAEAGKALFPDDDRGWRIWQMLNVAARRAGAEKMPSHHGGAWPLPNVNIGVSVENQEAADERIPDLLATPAAVRFLSCEPLLGPVDLTHRASNHALVGATAKKILRDHGAVGEVPSHLRPPSSIDWVIAGCESGPDARPCEVEWLRSLRDQCADAGVAFFLKQARETKLGVCGDSDNQNGDRPCRKPVTAYVIGPDTAAYSCGCTIEGAELGACVPLGEGEGSKRKTGGIIELPYLDGVQHAEFPRAGDRAQLGRGEADR